MPTTRPKPLVHGTLLDTTPPVDPGLYKVPADKIGGTPRRFTFCNLDASARTVTVWIVRSGQPIEDRYIVVPPATELRAGAQLPADVVHTMAPGDYLTAAADAAGVVAFRVDGAETTET